MQGALRPASPSSVATVQRTITDPGRNTVRSRLVFRLIGAVILGLVGWQVGSLVQMDPGQPRNAMLGIALGIVIGFAVAPIVLEKPYNLFKRVAIRTPLSDLVFGIVGLILGLIVAALLAYPLSFLPWWFGHVLPAIVALTFAYLGVSALMMRRRELAGFLHTRLSHEDGEQNPEKILIDTSAIIDGRIADLAETGFLRGTLVVPQFVLTELQHVADSADALRRNRGRRGLETLNRMKESPTPVEISDIDARDVPEVDGKLVALARRDSWPIVTNDFNLNRVAELQGVTVLNINQLANALKPVVLPGEIMAVRVIQEGKEINQGVGYLDDGTMIVVENGRRYLHAEIEVVVTRVLQTVAGRMIFAQIKDSDHRL